MQPIGWVLRSYAMTSRNTLFIVVSVWVSITYTLMVSGSEDLQKECSVMLQSLLACEPYLQGRVALPSKTCCDRLIQADARDKRCLCYGMQENSLAVYLELGIHINRTLALYLPDRCNVKSSKSRCPEILGLAAESPVPMSSGENDSSRSSAANLNSGSRESGSPNNKPQIKLTAVAMFFAAVCSVGHRLSLF